MAWSTLQSSAYNAYRLMVPFPEDRILLTARSSLYFAPPLSMLLCLAYLARRPDTFFLRSLLLPVTILSILGTFLRFTFSTTGAELDAKDGILPQVAISLVARAIDFTWRSEGMLKMHEEKPGVPMNTKDGAHHDIAPETSIWKTILPPWLYDSLELIFTHRGIGWKFGATLQVPREHRSLERSAFLKGTLMSVFKHFLIIDACDTFIKLIPGVGSPGGGLMYRPELPIPERYILALAIVYCTGTFMISCFHMVYGVITLIVVGLFSGQPKAWPPIMDNPWESDSLHIFWAKHWHQLFREIFFVYGGFIGTSLGGKTGRALGTFVGSGLFHVLPVFVNGMGFKSNVFAFFMLQAPMMLAERLWAYLTGRRVSGIYGRVWAYLALGFSGQLLVNAWCIEGLWGVKMVDPNWSPVRCLLVPMLVQASSQVGLHGLAGFLQPVNQMAVMSS